MWLALRADRSSSSKRALQGSCFEHQAPVGPEGTGDRGQRGVPVVSDDVHGHIAAHDDQVGRARPDHVAGAQDPGDSLTSGPGRCAFEHRRRGVNPRHGSTFFGQGHRQQTGAATKINDATGTELVRELPEEVMIGAAGVIDVVQQGQAWVVVGPAIPLRWGERPVCAKHSAGGNRILHSLICRSLARCRCQCSS